MDAQLIQGGEVLAAEVAAITQLLLVALDVLKEGLQLLEGLSAGFHHTLVHLGEQRRVTGAAHCGKKQGKPSASFSEIIATGSFTKRDHCPLSHCAGGQLS